MPVYFIQAMGLGGAVKVGHAKTPTMLESRLAAINTHVPFPVRLVGMRLDFPDLRAELEMHRRLTPWRIKGEWYWPQGDVLREMALCAPVVWPPKRTRSESHKLRLDDSPLRNWLRRGRKTLKAFAAEMGVSRYIVLSACHEGCSEGCSRAAEIEAATNGAVTARELQDFWLAQCSRRPRRSALTWEQIVAFAPREAAA